VKLLEKEFGVRLRVPRSDAPAGSMVTVQGSPAACEECEKRVREIVQEMSRGKARPKPKAKPQSHVEWPPVCQLCNCGIDGLITAFAHLGGARHFKAVEERLSRAMPVDHAPGPDNILGVEAFLRDDAVRELHSELGFDVDGLLRQVPVLEQRRLAAEALERDVSRQPAIFEWIHVEQRWRSAWDASPPDSGKTADILEARAFEEMSMRCLLDESPPLIREVGLPAPLPRADPKGRTERILAARHLYPFEPSSRLGVVVALQRGLQLSRFDLICGTSLIKALSGDGKRCADTYFLQKCQGALCCLHVTSSFYGQDDAGHAVEKLFCGADTKRPRMFVSSSKVRIGDRHVLISSEVDARDENDELVEIKTSGSKRGASIITATVSLQLACNGSGQVLCCGLDADKTQVLDVEKVPVAEAKEMHRQALVKDGQRISLLLERLCGHALFETGPTTRDELGPVVKLTFDKAKAPVLELAPSHVRVLPLGLPPA